MPNQAKGVKQTKVKLLTKEKLPNQAKHNKAYKSQQQNETRLNDQQ